MLPKSFQTKHAQKKKILQTYFQPRDNLTKVHVSTLPRNVELRTSKITHRSLYGRPEGDGLVRVNTLAGLFSKELFHQALNLWDSRRPAHKHNIRDLAP